MHTIEVVSGVRRFICKRLWQF